MIIIHPVNIKKLKCVYKIEFPDGSFYIGSTSNLHIRIQGYRNAFKNSRGSVNKLLASKSILFNKCHFTVIENVPDESICIKHYEDVWIKKYANNPLILNRSKSAFSNEGMVKSK